MASHRQETVERFLKGPLFAAALLRVLGIIVLIVTLAGAVIALALRISRERAVDGTSVAWLAGLFVVGLTLGGLLLAFAALLRYGYVVARAYNLELREGYEAGFSGPYGVEGEAVDDRLLPHECPGSSGMIGDLSLLAPQERELGRERLREHRERRAAEQVIEAVNARQLGRARLLLDDAKAFFGSTPRLEKLKGRIEQAAARNEKLDYARSKRLVEEAIADGRWASAERDAQALCFDHPDSQLCRHLWDDTRRARLHNHIQQRAQDHDWPEALAATEEFLERFPEGNEAEALGDQMPTLRANAEIHQRKQYEAKLKLLVEAGRYAEALRLAKLVVDRYPTSPQALALRDQIPLLEKRANG